MKNILIVLGFLLLAPSCGRNQAEILFEMPLRNVDFAIPAGLNILDSHFFEIKNIPTDVEGLFNTFNTDINQINSIEPGKATLLNLFSNYGFNFCGEIAVRIFTDANPTKTEIFYRDPVPEDAGATLDLIPSAVDIQEYLKEEFVHLEIKFGRMRMPTQETIDCRLAIDFNVL